MRGGLAALAQLVTLCFPNRKVPRTVGVPCLRYRAFRFLIFFFLSFFFVVVADQKGTTSFVPLYLTSLRQKVPHPSIQCSIQLGTFHPSIGIVTPSSANPPHLCQLPSSALDKLPSLGTLP